MYGGDYSTWGPGKIWGVIVHRGKGKYGGYSTELDVQQNLSEHSKSCSAIDQTFKLCIGVHVCIYM